MEQIIKIIIALSVFVIFGFIVQSNVYINPQKPVQYYPPYPIQNVRPNIPKPQTQSQAIITANEPIVIKPLKQSGIQPVKVNPVNPNIKGISEQELFRKKLQSKKEKLKYNLVKEDITKKKEGFVDIHLQNNELNSNPNYAEYMGMNSDNLTETQIEENDIFNKLFN